MGGYIEKQAAIDEINKALDRETLLNSFVRKIAVEAVKKMSSADVVEVVRCKDCRLSEHDIDIIEFWCCYWDNKTLENGYCSYGERKDGE